MRDGTPYPAVLLSTGLNDFRAEPFQAGKMATRRQAATRIGFREVCSMAVYIWNPETDAGAPGASSSGNPRPGAPARE